MPRMEFKVNNYVVATTSLNLRRTPNVAPNNVIGVLRHGQSVEALDQSDTNFWQVRTELRNQVVLGYASANYLTPTAAVPKPVEAASIVPVDFPTNPGSRLDSVGFRHCPLADSLVAKPDIQP